MHTNTVAVIGLSDLHWIISVFGLVRVGFVVLLLSPRLSARESLVKGKHPVLSQMAQAIHAQKPVPLLSMLGRKDYDTNANVKPFPSNRQDREGVVIIMHSSGSTGFPKPIYTKHYRYTMASAPGPGTSEMMTLPLSVGLLSCVALADVAQLLRLFLHRLYTTLISSKDNIFPKPKYALDM